MYYWYRDSIQLYNWFKWTADDYDELNEFKSDRMKTFDDSGHVHIDNDDGIYFIFLYLYYN